MSVSSDSPADRVPGHGAHVASALDAVLAEAGGILAPHRGGTVAISYGSATGELAACLNGVGIASRSELTKLELSGPEASLNRVLEGLLDRPLAPGGMLLSGAVGWYRLDERRLLALCDPAHGERLRGRLEFWTMRDHSVTLQDRTDRWAVIAVVGRMTDEVLGELGVYGPSRDPRTVRPITRTGDDPDTAWLLCAGDYALALTPCASAPALWRSIATAGRRWRICAVGLEALVRYRMSARAARL